MGNNNKDKKAKKKEADAKLRQHVEAGINEVLTSTNAALTSHIVPQSAQSLLSHNNPKDAAALFFLQQQQQRSQQQQQMMNQNDDDGDDDDDENTVARNDAVVNARINRLTGGGNNNNADNNSTNNQNSGNAVNKNNNATNNSSGVPKRKRFRQEEMKLALEKALGTAKGTPLVPFVDEHTGNAPEPFVCVQIRASSFNVPVPSHWTSVSAYLSQQNDRPEAVVMLPDVKASGVEFVRTGANTRPDIRQFAKAFLSGNPLQVKTYSLRLMEKGEQYEGSRWRPSKRITPGKISEHLRVALGMLSQNSPPPWIHAMQRVGDLPPSYPTGAAYPGLNAPIPEGGQWGFARGQWGQPVRKEDGSFKFPAVQSLGNTTTVVGSSSSAATQQQQEPVPLPFGTVPPRRRAVPTAEEEAAKAAAEAAAAAAKAAAEPKLKPPSSVAAAAASVVPVSLSAVMASGGATANKASYIPPFIGGSLQIDEYLKDVAATADEDDLLSAGARLVSANRGANPAARASAPTVNLAPSFGM